jgi:hypothetical protein
VGIFLDRIFSDQQDCAGFGGACGGSVAENVWLLFVTFSE